MTDYIESLWAQFFIESEEHIELIEPVLVEAEFNTPSRENVDQLFRSFHSIKGLSKAMDLLGMETISHRAEDLLGLVRDEVITIDAELADALLASIDALKHHLQFAEEKRKDKKPSAKLVKRLESIFSNVTCDASTDEAMVDSSDLESGSHDTSEQSDSTFDAVSTSQPEQHTSSLHDDPDMVVFFAELLQLNLPILADTLVPGFTPGSDAAKEIVEELETLIHAASTMELVLLADAFSSISNLLSDKELTLEMHKESLVEKMMVLVDLIRFIENDVKKECGIAPIIINLKSSTAEMIDGLFLELTDQLRAVSEGDALCDAGEVIDFAVQTTEKAVVLNNYLQALDGNETSKQLVLTVSEVCNHINQGHAVPETGLIHLLLNAVSVAESEYRLGAKNEKSSRKPVDWNSLHEKIWDVIKQQRDVESDEELGSFKELAEIIEINPIFEDCLSADAIRLLQDEIDDGGKVYEAMVNLEESETFTASFLEWIDKNVQLVTNSTVFVDDKPWSDCLLLTKQSDKALRESVKALDPERQFIKLENCAEIDEKSSHETSAATGKVDKELSTVNKELSMLRVSGAALDQFMSQIGEMVSIRGMLNHTVHFEGASTAINVLKQLGRSLSNDGVSNEHFLAQMEILELQFARFNQVDQKLHSVLSQLQDSALALRVVPMETVFKRLPRPVRDLAQAQGKQVKLEMTGQDVRIDKAMVEVLSDPLMHMVRNSVDHGIEPPEERLAAGKSERAVVGLEARQQGNTVKVTITDDGRGISVEAVKAKALAKGLVREEDLQRMSHEEIMQFIFAPGFSTAEQITETSGRGVGMDVARTNVMKLGGNVTVESESGKGSCFTLELPLSAAIQDTILVEASGQMMAIPERYVSEVIEIKRSDVQMVKGCQAIVLRDNFLPVYNLGPLLGYQSQQKVFEEAMVVAVLSDGKQRIGVVINRSYLRQELFIKDIHEQLTALPGVSGASILGDGKVVLILEVEDLFTLAIRHGKTALLELDTTNDNEGNSAKQANDPELKESEGTESMQEERVA